MRYRAIPGFSEPLSEIGLEAPTPDDGASYRPRGGSSWVERARGLGINLVSLRQPTRDTPERWGTKLSTSNPTRRTVLLLRLPEPDSSADERGRERFRTAVEQLAGPDESRWQAGVTVEPDLSSDSRTDEWPDRIQRLLGQESSIRWGVSLPPAYLTAEGLERIGTTAARWVETTLSLLDLSLTRRVGALLADSALRVIVRDPFVGGLLDGTFSFGSNADPGGPRPPMELSGLERRFEPVLKLAPLTAGGVRTLPQANVQFLLQHPWIASVLVSTATDLPFDALSSTEELPPLDPASLDQIRSH